jgi:hypothetical protein
MKCCLRQFKATHLKWTQHRVLRRLLARRGNESQTLSNIQLPKTFDTPDRDELLCERSKSIHWKEVIFGSTFETIRSIPSHFLKQLLDLESNASACHLEVDLHSNEQTSCIRFERIQCHPQSDRPLDDINEGSATSCSARFFSSHELPS